MGIILYHACLPDHHPHHVPLNTIMEEGIKSTSPSNFVYGNGGKIKVECTEQCRPVEAPDWIDFKKAVGVNLFNRYSKSFCFPLFTEKIMVFDGEISLFIYDQTLYEDLRFSDEESWNFDTGESIEYWVREYWKSMKSLKQYVEEQPYQKPEILIFEDVPKRIINICEEESEFVG